MKWIKEFFYKSKSAPTPVDEEEERFEAIRNSDLNLNKLGLCSIQLMFLNEIFFYQNQAITAKQKQIKNVIASLKKDKSKKEESIEIEEQGNTIRFIIDTNLLIFKAKAESIYIEGVRKSIKKIMSKNEKLINATHAFEQEWLESNETYNKELKNCLDVIRLKMLKEMQDGGIKDTDYSDLIKEDKDTGRKPIDASFFSKIKI
jgi:hypothetical protein